MASALASGAGLKLARTTIRFAPHPESAARPAAESRSGTTNEVSRTRTRNARPATWALARPERTRGESLTVPGSGDATLTRTRPVARMALWLELRTWT